MRYESWVFLFLYAENRPENATKMRQIRKNFRKQDLACRSKNPPTIFDVNSQKTGGLYSDDENFAGGHKKSAATLKHKMERSEISTNRKRSQTTTFWRCKIGTRKLLTHAEFAWLRSSQTDLMRQILRCGFTMIRQFQNQEHYAESTLIYNILPSISVRLGCP